MKTSNIFRRIRDLFLLKLLAIVVIILFCKVSVRATTFTQLTFAAQQSEQVSQPSWSPDGSKILYVKGISSLWYVSPNGGTPVNVPITGPGTESVHPVWSPDGTKIAFRRYFSWPTYQICTIPAAGGALTQITNITSENSWPSWSPDGSKIVFSSRYPGNQGDIYVVPSTGGSATLLYSSPYHDGVPVWSPDGLKIAFESNNKLWVMNSDGTNAKQLVFGNSVEYRPAWSPDSKWIAFTSTRSGNEDIWVISSEGGEPIQITNDPQLDCEPAWSPDNSKIAFSSRMNGGWQNIWVASDLPLAMGEIRGSVFGIDEQGRTISLGGTEVKIDGTGGIFTVYTNTTGGYSLTMPIGTYSVTASADKYIPQTKINVIVTKNSTTWVPNFVLSPLSASLTSIWPREGDILNSEFNDYIKANFNKDIDLTSTNYVWVFVEIWPINVLIPAGVEKDASGLHSYKIGMIDNSGNLLPLKIGWNKKAKIRILPNKIKDIDGSWVMVDTSVTFMTSVGTDLRITNVEIKPEKTYPGLEPYETYLGVKSLVKLRIANMGTQNWTDRGLEVFFQERDYCGAGEVSTPWCIFELSEKNYGSSFSPPQPVTVGKNLVPGEDVTLGPYEFQFLSIYSDSLFIWLFSKNGPINDNFGNNADIYALEDVRVKASPEAYINCISLILSTYLARKGVMTSPSLIKDLIECGSTFYHETQVSHLLLDNLSTQKFSDSSDPQFAKFLAELIYHLGKSVEGAAPCFGETVIPGDMKNNLKSLGVLLGVLQEVWPFLQQYSPGGCAVMLSDIIRNITANVMPELNKIHAWREQNNMYIYLMCPTSLEVVTTQGDSLLVSASGPDFVQSDSVFGFRFGDNKEAIIPSSDTCKIIVRGLSEGVANLELYQPKDTGAFVHISFLSLPVSETLYYVIPQFDTSCNNYYAIRHSIANPIDSSLIFPKAIMKYTEQSNCAVSGRIFRFPYGISGVTIDLFDSTGVLLAVTMSDGNGQYSFPNLSKGDYTVSIVTPLSFSAKFETDNVVLSEGIEVIANFYLSPLSIKSAQRSVGFWKHQVNAHLNSKGKPEVTLAQLSNYMNLIHAHFNNNLANPVTIFQVSQPATQMDSLRVLQSLLTVNQGGTMNDRAKQQLIALLLNVVSGKLHQATFISQDSATVSQAITYCNYLINSDTLCSEEEDGDNDDEEHLPSRKNCLEIAKEIAEEINEGEMIEGGIIPLTTPNIMYKETGDQIVKTQLLPKEFSLSYNYPNPFNPRTQIDYALPKDCNVELTIFNILGQKVKTLADEFQTAGFKTVNWDGKDDKGQECASGIYFYRLKAAEFSQAKKMVIVK